VDSLRIAPERLARGVDWPGILSGFWLFGSKMLRISIILRVVGHALPTSYRTRRGDLVSESTEASVRIIPFGRRVIVMAIVMLLAQPLLALLDLVSNLLMAFGLLPSAAGLTSLILRMPLNFAVLGGIAMLLIRVQRQYMRGEKSWLAGLTEGQLIGALVGALVLVRIVPRAYWEPDGGRSQIYNVVSQLFPIVIFVWLIAACYLWIWWCNCPRPLERLVGVTALAFIAFEWATGFLDYFLPSMLLVFVASSSPDSGVQQFQIPGTDTWCTLHPSMGLLDMGTQLFSTGILRYMFTSFLSALVAAGVALVIYAATHRSARKPEQAG